MKPGIDAESQPTAHAGAVGGNWSIKLTLEIGKGCDSFNLILGLVHRNTVKGQLQTNIFAAGLLGTEHAPLIDPTDTIAEHRD